MTKIKITEGFNGHVDSKEITSRIDLRDLMVPGRAHRGRAPQLIRCLFHNEERPSMAVYQNGAHCFGCGKHISTLDWIALQEGLDIERDFTKVLEVAQSRYALGVSIIPRKIEKKQLVAWEPMKQDLALKYHKLLGEARDWFRGRGISDWVIDEEKFGYTGRAFSIPVWNAKGELMTIRYRRDDSLDKEGQKYWGTDGRNSVILVNEKVLQADVLREDGVVVLCEGELDTFRVWSEKIPAVTVTNGAGSFDESFVGMFKLAEKVLVCMDMDDTGIENAVRVCKVFGSRGRVIMWNKEEGKDVTEYLLEHTVDEFRCLMKKAKRVGEIDKYWSKKFEKE